ncbi:MAG: polymer-forming cytoskeletal protein [Candidatus Margulisbacteria bacterium]|nr:polymer-forming cytoskeletal protein [Candidatus Margulisiibacteriota bacterium]
MGLFNFEREQNTVSHGPVDTIIGGKAKFKGEIVAQGGVSINGEFEGKIKTEGELILAPGSKVVGEIQGGHILVSGKVDGNITAVHLLEINKTGRVHGDITGGKIVIEEGSSYCGKVQVVSPDDASIQELDPAA